jgi:UDP-N-acetyl-D-glucosamine dehydrogenase
MNSKTVAIVGLGYVGLPLAVLTAINKFEVIGFELDEDKVEQINNGIPPIKDELVETNLKKGLFQATNEPKKLKKADIVIVCVPTPVYNDYQPNLDPLKKACKTVALNLKKNALVIVESTINPGVSEEVVLPIFEDIGLKPGEDFFLSHCPERINPGDPKWNVGNIPRVVGSYDETGLHKTLDFYRSIVKAEIKPMNSLKEAEAVKIVENTYRDVNIAFVNELAMSFTKLGINVVNVINGAATKPFAFMPHYPGVGVGGHCIPVDPYYLIEYAKSRDFNHDFLILARTINNQMPDFTIQRLVDGLDEAGLALSRSRVAVLGISYKANINDDRESPTYKIMKLLDAKKVSYDVYDPYSKKSTVDTLEDALSNKDAVIIVTAHKEFLDLEFKDLQKSGIKVLVDGRNSLNADKIIAAGIIYRGVGT